MADGAGMFRAISLLHFSIFTSFSQFSIFGRNSRVTTREDDAAELDDISSFVEACKPPRECFLSRRPFNRGGSLPLLRFCSACRAAAYDHIIFILLSLSHIIITYGNRLIRFPVRMLSTPTLKWPSCAISPRHLLCNFWSLNSSSVFIFKYTIYYIGLFLISCIVLVYFPYMYITELLFWRNEGIIIIIII